MIEVTVYLTEHTTEYGAMSGLAALLQTAMDQRGWSLRDLAAESGVPVSTLSNIMNSTKEPRLGNLSSLSRALELPLRTLVEACGYPVEGLASNDEAQARIQALVSAVPDLKLFLEGLSELSADDRAAALAMVQGLAQKSRDRRRKG